MFLIPLFRDVVSRFARKNSSVETGLLLELRILTQGKTGHCNHHF